MPRHLVTSAPPCLEGVAHLGDLASSMLPADVYARFLRARGEEVLFVCSSDEHGSAAELAAAEAGLGVADYCTRQHRAQVGLAAEFGLSFDAFGRSSSPQNRQQAQYFTRRLDEEGYLEARSTRQLFSPADGRFLFDRCVVGTCPHCHCDRARGDQCEDCGRLLEPTELIEPRSAISGSRDLEVRESRQLFLLQSKLAGELRAWLESRSGWPAPARSMGLGWLDEGVGDRSITRDLPWGVPVERSGFEGKAYCARFDAPIAYIGATREWAEARGEPGAWRRWWCGSEDVSYAQFMGRDDVPFHTVGFSSAVLGSRESWKQVDLLGAFHRLTYRGERFSAPRRIGVPMDLALELCAPDCWRYYLIANAPEAEDAHFSWRAFGAAVNEDLAGTFGGFVARSLALGECHFGGEVPAGGEPGEAEARLARAAGVQVEALTARIAALEFRQAVAELRVLWGLGNDYLDRKQLPEAPGGDRDDAALTVRTCLELLALLARSSAPFLPFAAGRLLEALGLPEEPDWPQGFDPGALDPGRRFSVPPPLFHRVSAGEIETWRDRFDGSQGFDPCSGALTRSAGGT